MLNRRELLSCIPLIGIAEVAGTFASLSPLELIAQEETKSIELPILWSDKKHFVKEPVYSNGIIFSQQVETENPAT